MKHLRYFFTSLAFLAFVSVAHADDNQDVLEAVEKAYSAWRNLDIGLVKDSLDENFNLFHQNGNLLEEVNWEGLKQWFESGPTINIQPFHPDVRVYGDTAIYTAYERINIRNSNGDTVNETRRSTNVLVKKKGRWRTVHWHGSLLTPVNPE